MEFIQMEPDDQQQLRELIRQTELATAPRNKPRGFRESVLKDMGASQEGEL